MSKQEQLLFTPGPVPITDSVRDAMHDLTYHKSDEFEIAHRELTHDLRAIIGCDGSILIAPGSGTTGAEIFMRGMVPFQSNVLVLVQGRFSSRWAELGRMFGHTIMTMKCPWGECIPIEALAQVLTEHTFHSIWITHTETSTAMTVPLKEYCDVIQTYSPESFIIVDAVSSIGIESFNQTQFGIDCVFTASQKGLAAPPGATILSLSKRAKEQAIHLANESLIFPSMVHHLPTMIDSADKHLPMFTPPLPIISALRTSCNAIVHDESRYESLLAQARYIKEMLSDIKGCIVSGNAIGVTVIKHPDASRILPALREYGLVIAPGQDEWKDSAFRIGHMVKYSEEDLQRLEIALRTICGAL